MTKSSRISGLYKRSMQERITLISEWAELNDHDQSVISGRNGLDASKADLMIENAIGIYSLPLGVATNFLINGKDFLVPMVIEEPSVIAAVSNAARLFRQGGGFTTTSDDPIMIGQIQLLDVKDVYHAASTILENKSALLAEANELGGSIIRLGGGARDLEVRPFPDARSGPMLIIHLLYDTRDAMGANAINSAVEHIAPHIESLTGGRVNLRILSNLTDRRKARAQGIVLAKDLDTETVPGQNAVSAIVEAGVFAEIDPYRAATHNKGIMNGIDAVVIATGNDWRAIEAGAHAYATRDGQYTSLTRWWQDEDGNLRGSIELPLALGTVGGATKVHPAAGVALKILGTQSARELSEIAAAVGLAQNLAAIKALATEGIQRGHMRMHAKQLAVAAGATGALVAQIVHAMIREDNIRLERARSLVQELSEAKSVPTQDSD